MAGTGVFTPDNAMNLPNRFVRSGEVFLLPSLIGFGAEAPLEDQRDVRSAFFAFRDGIPVVSTQASILSRLPTL